MLEVRRWNADELSEHQAEEAVGALRVKGSVVSADAACYKGVKVRVLCNNKYLMTFKTSSKGVFIFSAHHGYRHTAKIRKDTRCGAAQSSIMP